MTKVSAILLLLIVACSITSSLGLQNELSVLIEPGKRECFHQFLNEGMNIEVDYQVIQGGEMDVSFWIGSPANRIIVTELRKSQGQHQFRTQELGDYSFCFDNSFSRFAFKQVFFYIGSQDQFIDPHFQSKSIYEEIKAEKDQLGELDDKLGVFKQRFTQMLIVLESAQRIQNTFRTFEIIDRNIMEHNYERINFWSMVNIGVMLAVSILQVYMIRSLFEDKSKVGRVLRNFKTSTD